MPAGVAAGLCCPLDLLGPLVLPPCFLGPAGFVACVFCPLVLPQFLCGPLVLPLLVCCPTGFAACLFVGPPTGFATDFWEYRTTARLNYSTFNRLHIYTLPYPLPKTSLSDLPARNYIVAFIPALFTHFDIS